MPSRHPLAWPPWVAVATALLTLAVVSGCVSRGEPEGGGSPLPPVKRVTVQVDSIPSGTTVKVNGMRMGQAPLTLQLIEDENGELRERTEIVGDNSVNPRTPNSFSSATLLLDAGQEAPTRIWFTETGGTMTVEATGRAIVPLERSRRN